MALRNYVNTSKEAQLSLPVGTGDTTITLTAPGLVNIPPTPFYVRLDPDTASEEIILVGSGSSATSLMNCTRGYDGTSAFSHLAGSKARHCVAAEFYNKADAHAEASTNVHGLSGGSAVAGTSQTQTLTNKTINASVIDVAHSTSPAASQAYKVSADNATSRDGFVWDNTGGSSGRSVVVRAGGVDRFVVTGVGLMVSNSATGTDKALSVQNAAVERFFIQADGHADFALQAGGATVDRVRIRTQNTQNALAVKDSGGFNIFTIGGSGNVDASGYLATATNLSATGSLTVGTTGSIGGNFSVTGTTTLTGATTMPLPAAGTTQRLIARSRTGGTNFEGQNQAGTATFYVRETGQLGISDKALIHNGLSPAVALVSGTGVVPSPTNPMLVFDDSDSTLRRYNGSTWDAVGKYGTLLANPIALINGQVRGSNTATITTTETQFLATNSVTLAASSVYVVDLDMKWNQNTTGDQFLIKIRHTNTSGAIQMQDSTDRLATVPLASNYSLLYVTTSSEASRVFIASIVRLSGSGGAIVEAGSSMKLTYLGPSSLITSI